MRQPSFHSALSRREALRSTAGALDARGIVAGDARFLVLGVLGLGAIDLALHGDRPIGSEGAAGLNDALRRRLSGEPVARILGAWEFWGLPFRLSPETLVPRPDTETVIEAVLRMTPNRAAPLRILDLGTGSGCILVALLSELSQASGVGLDRSAAALRTARANAARNGVGARAAFVAADWCDPLRGRFDIVVSNPPYIPAPVLPGLAPEVRDHDPTPALDGGVDGLDAYRRIFDGVSRNRLSEAGALVLEVGFDQAAAVAEIGAGMGLTPRGVTPDLAGHARVLAFAAVAPSPNSRPERSGRPDVAGREKILVEPRWNGY